MDYSVKEDSVYDNYAIVRMRKILVYEKESFSFWQLPRSILFIYKYKYYKKIYVPNSFWTIEIAQTTPVAETTYLYILYWDVLFLQGYSECMTETSFCSTERCFRHTLTIALLLTVTPL